jgi:TonB family protein
MLHTMPTPAAATTFPDDDFYRRRLRSLNTVVDRLPELPPQDEETVFAGMRPRNTAVLDEEQDSEEDEARSLTFLTDSAELDEDQRTKRKWMMIMAVGAGSILLVAFQLLHSGTLSMLKQMAVPQPQPTVTDSTELLVSTPKKSPATRFSAGGHGNLAAGEQATDDAGTTNQIEAAPAQAQSEMMHDQLLAPTRIPQNLKTAAAADAPPAGGFGGASMAALGGNSTVGSVFGESAGSNVPAVGLRPVTVSAGVAVGMLIHKTPPTYPPIARAARVSGTVVMEATITQAGTVANLHVVSGPAMLRQAAVDAVKTWRYKPYKLNNEPTEVQTTINVIFALGG